MEAQTARDPPRHRSRYTAPNCNRVRGNAQVQTMSTSRAVKRETAEEQKAGLYTPKTEIPLVSCNNGLIMLPLAQESNQKLKMRGPPVEPECFTSWIRDEPYNPGGSFLEMGSVGTGRNCNAGIVRSHGVADGAGTLGCTSDLTEDRRKALTAQVCAQLRATPVKESVILESIERHGGGHAGLRAVVGAILIWVQARNRRNRTKSGESCPTQAELSSVHVADQIPWQSLDSESIVDAVMGLSKNSKSGNHSSSTDPVTGLAQSPSSCGDGESSLGDLRAGDSGSGEYGLVPTYESQPHIMGGPEAGVVLSGGLRSQGSGHEVRKDMPSDQWVPQVSDLRQEKAHGAKAARQQSPSPDHNGVNFVPDLYGFDEALRQHSKVLRQSRSSAEYTSSAQSSNEFHAYFNTAPPEGLGTQGIFSEANPFAPGGPFNMSSSSPLPPDSQPMDFNVFQGHVLIDENMGLGSSIHGCGPLERLGSLGSSIDRKPSIARLGVVATFRKTSPAACTRLARKQRMDRNRKAAVCQLNRGAFENSALLASKSGGLCSPGTLRSTCRSQGSPPHGPTCRIVDRRHQENLQFLLMKVLRPSDVGNLGRIVLPKKDAESHLPWLSAREGIQLTCEDYDTGEMMTLRYRFWPNNKSRMYLLENTGDFVKRHQLQESDRMLIYRNQSQGTYIIRARKAQDCVDGKAQNATESLPNPSQPEETEVEVMEITEQDSPEGPCSSGTSSQSAESASGSGHDGVSLGVIISHDDLLNFADLPDAPMGEGTEHLVRFPSLESFDVELLELATVTGKEEDVTSCTAKAKGE